MPTDSCKTTEYIKIQNAFVQYYSHFYVLQDPEQHFPLFYPWSCGCERHAVTLTQNIGVCSAHDRQAQCRWEVKQRMGNIQQPEHINTNYARYERYEGGEIMRKRRN